jgi:hypothetical protein
MVASLPGSFLANFSRTSLPCSREIGQKALGYLLPRGNGSARAWRWRSRQPAALVISHYRFVVLPCDVFISVEQKTPGNLEPEAWVALRRVLDLIQAAGADGDPRDDEMIEQDLRARLAVPVEAK